MKTSETRYARSLAAALIRSLLADGEFSREELATELVILVERLDRYAAGQERVPFDRQLYLSLLAIERPAYAQRGHTLKSQALAALAFERHETEIHSGPPVGRVWKVY